MTSLVLFTVFILLTGGERIVELFISRRNAALAFARGGVESGRGHFPAMVALHTGLLVGALAEVWLLGRPFIDCRSYERSICPSAKEVKTRYWSSWKASCSSSSSSAVSSSERPR